MKRSELLAKIQYAGFHNDVRAGIRLKCENRVSIEVYNREFRAGQQVRANGGKCHCSSCQEQSDIDKADQKYESQTVEGL